MNTDLWYVCAGFFLMIVLPVAAGSLNTIWKNEILQGKVLYYLTVIFILIQLEWHGNEELLIGFVLGCSLCKVLVFEGVHRLLHPDDKVKTERESNYYLSFSVIVTMILSADYLFGRKSARNQVGWIDGGLLLFLLLIFIFCSVRRYPLKKEYFNDFFFLIGNGNHVAASICFDLFIIISIFFGSYFLVHGAIGISIEYKISFELTGLFFLSWMCNLVNLYHSVQRKETAVKMITTSASETVIFFLLSFGLGAVISEMSISYSIIYQLIFFSLISILLVWRDKARNDMAGSCMLTLYVAFLVMAVMV